jgi:hypothetical protein
MELQKIETKIKTQFLKKTKIDSLKLWKTEI